MAHRQSVMPLPAMGDLHEAPKFVLSIGANIISRSKSSVIYGKPSCFETTLLLELTTLRAIQFCRSGLGVSGGGLT